MNHRRLLVVVLFLVIFSFDVARETDIDFWWHLRTGERIAVTGSVPRTDPFSYTADGHPWVAHEWLWELAIYFLYRRGGYVLAMLVSALLVTLTFAILYRLLRRLGTNEIVSALLVLWAAVLALPNLGVRPRELTHLLLTWYVSRVLLYRAGHVRQLWALPVAMVFWVNLHGAFVLGIAVLALCILGMAMEWWLSDGRSPAHLISVGLLTLVAATVNPAGPQLLLYPFGYYWHRDNPSFRIVTEFQSPNFHDPVMLLFAAGILLFMVLGVRERARNSVDALLVVAFAGQALISARQLSAAALVMAPILALVLCERFRLARELAPTRLPRPLLMVNWVILVVLIGAGLIFAARPQIRAKLQIGMEPTTRELPLAGIRFIEDNNLRGPLFNNQPWGGYLIYRWYPQRRVFIDGRIDMYGADIVREYTDVVTIKPGWRAVLDKYRIQTTLIEKDSALSVLLLADGGWERVFQGDVEDVFVRRQSPPGAPGI